MEPGRSRRRGTALDEAILAAAWAELTEHGYIDMTLELSPDARAPAGRFCTVAGQPA